MSQYWVNFSTVCVMLGKCKDTIEEIVSILFCKEKYFWKLLCLCCTGFLLLELFRDFFCLKPTVSTVEEIHLSQIQFPDVLVCLEHGFDNTHMKRHGYETTFQYFLGFSLGNTNFIGWNGLKGNDSLRTDSDNSFCNPFDSFYVVHPICSHVGI